jgi:hypothetical protein
MLAIGRPRPTCEAVFCRILHPALYFPSLSVEDNGPGAVFSATAEQERVVWTPGQVSNAVGLASHLVLDLGTLSLHVPEYDFSVFGPRGQSRPIVTKDKEPYLVRVSCQDMDRLRGKLTPWTQVVRE